MKQKSNIINVQVRIPEDLHQAARVDLAKKRQSWQAFLEGYIKMKYGAKNEKNNKN